MEKVAETSKEGKSEHKGDFFESESMHPPLAEEDVRILGVPKQKLDSSLDGPGGSRREDKG